ncbi:MAG: TIR domain-containing protein [Bryobacteraceae bacterium]
MPAKRRLLKLFLCHSSGDKTSVRDLFDLLQNDGANPWLDERQLLPGQHWEDEIRQAIRSADIVVICLSSKSVTKEGFVQKEIALALDLSAEKPEGTIFLVPLRLEDCPVPARLKHLHYVDFFVDGGYERILAACRLRAKQLGVRLQAKRRESHGATRREPIVIAPAQVHPHIDRYLFHVNLGERVRVVQGALAGLEGVLIGMKSPQRAIVNVSMLQRAISIEIDTEWILPIVKR